MIYFFYTVYALSFLWATFNILLYGDRPARSVGWILIIIILPIIGVTLYIIFGVNRKKFKFFRLNFNAKRRLYDFNKITKNIEEDEQPFVPKKYSKIDNLLKASSDFPTLEDNEVVLLKDGRITFDTIFEAMENAEKFIHAQYYILEKGDILDRIFKIFEQKISEGVEVRMLYDAVGSHDLKGKRLKRLKKIGVHIFPILPLKFNTILSTINYRNHRKILVIDGKIAFTGGVNISDKYITTDNPLGKWGDMHLQLKGYIVDHLHRIFIKDYYFASNKTLLTTDEYLPKQKKEGDSLVQIVSGGPDHMNLSILHQYLAMIGAADKSIYIENPYFIPNKALLESLKMAALQGIDVRIMVPKKNDSQLAKYSMFSNFQELLRTGVKIYTLDKFSHSKLIIIDKEIASVGSGNFDYRSFEHNYEANTLLYDTKIAEELATDFESEIDNCAQLEYEEFKKRPLKVKLFEGAARIFSPLL
ncbi:putative cardiolipin synthase YwiE [Kordia antarctica]|uniref:Cardiolipin synthase n=1 Tax=Kordia antarctica TaxID=1218801 RepID=A0A7L4ZKW2_9FLAO|nr:cardiolipin synthase [Kordia antarctica]QHI36866.1 putative cardiolipin synthase YwiE [Kordia antarctica]